MFADMPDEEFAAILNELQASGNKTRLMEFFGQ
jgi:hypothetical protein